MGFWGLTALVFGLVIGVGIFNLPQNMARVASPGAVLLCWAVVSSGIVPLVIGFKWLSTRYPQYNAGIYHYAQAGFGNFTGFMIAWGYWLCSAFSNVAYGVMLNDTVGAFWPTLLTHGWWSVAFCSVLIWVMYFIVSRGLQTAKTVNSLLAVVKVLMLVFIIAVFALMFRMDLFTSDFWGNGLGSFKSLVSQVTDTMMVALFCFFGIEGAVMMSARARRPRDVGRAGVSGFLISMLLYVAVSVLCYGVVARSEMAGMPNPSVAYILRGTLGEWAYWFVISALTVALLGGWVAWTLVVAQVPYEASRVGILPKLFSHTNSKGMPDYGLIASSVAMEFFLLLIIFADDAYIMALRVTGLMIVPGYLFTGLFMWRKADGPGIKAVAAIIILFCLWMGYAGGWLDLMLTSVFYLAGTGFYVRARKEQLSPEMFTRGEMWGLCALMLTAVAAIVVSLLI